MDVSLEFFELPYGEMTKVPTPGAVDDPIPVPPEGPGFTGK